MDVLLASILVLIWIFLIIDNMSFSLRLLVIWISFFMKCLSSLLLIFFWIFFSFSYQFAKVLYVFWILLLYVLQIFSSILWAAFYFLSSVFSWVKFLILICNLTLKQHKFELYGSTCTEFFSILTQVVLCLQSMVDWILGSRIRGDVKGCLWDFSICRFSHLWQVLKPSPMDTEGWQLSNLSTLLLMVMILPCVRVCYPLWGLKMFSWVFF